MADNTEPPAQPVGTASRVGVLVPGVVAAALVAIAAMAGQYAVASIVAFPAIVIALIIGIGLNNFADRPLFRPGFAFCVKTLLRWAVALLGLRVSLGDIVDLGPLTALLVVASMLLTIIVGFAVARLLGLPAGFGALAGAGTAVCGASATLATATIVPAYRGKDADVIFVVVAVNALSTLAMLLYPLLGVFLGFDQHNIGILIGATIHDVAQVVGAGYAVSEPAGNTAVIVKLFRVLLLLPVVVGVGLCLASPTAERGRAKVPVPGFALVFLTLCVVNSIAGTWPGLAVICEPVKAWSVVASNWGLLIAIAALGLTTSISALRSVGWRHMLTVSATTLTILLLVTLALMIPH